MSSKKDEAKEFRIFSFHSVKGGVGKTSLALAVASWCSFFEKKRTLFIDADMTGTNVKDCLFGLNEPIPFSLNEFLLSNPDQYLRFFGRGQGSLRSKKFLVLENEGGKFDLLSSRSEFHEVRNIVSYLAQECHLHFFRERLMDLVFFCQKELKYDYLVFDFPPGLYGFSLAGIEALFQLKGEFAVTPVFVSSGDKVDYRAGIQGMGEFLTDLENRSEKMALFSTIRTIFNKVQLGKNENPAMAMGEIFKDLKSGENSPPSLKRMLDLILPDSSSPADSKKVGGAVLGLVNGFLMEDLPQKLSDFCQRSKNQNEKQILPLRWKASENSPEKWLQRVWEAVIS